MKSNKIKLRKPGVTRIVYLTPQSSSTPEEKKNNLKITPYPDKGKLNTLLVLKYRSVPYLIHRNYNTK